LRNLEQSAGRNFAGRTGYTSHTERCKKERGKGEKNEPEAHSTPQDQLREKSGDFERCWRQRFAKLEVRVLEVVVGGLEVVVGGLEVVEGWG